MSKLPMQEIRIFISPSPSLRIVSITRLGEGAKPSRRTVLFDKLKIIYPSGEVYFGGSV